MAHELTVQELEKFSADFNKNPKIKSLLVLLNVAVYSKLLIMTAFKAN